ncbi:MAG TPA: phytanoyl-CoA dioxygenase family protein [Thermoanaerobaculia bacterium]|nr:phytanoyl-CoA dioxygenase family protein [Thermoanaerobaculia bacterium]
MSHVANRPWIDSPFFPTALAEAGLDPETKKIVEFFAEHGYVIVDPEIDDRTIEHANLTLRDRFKQTYEPYYADTTRIQDAWWFNEHVKTIAVAPRILEILRILYQREPIPFQTLNFRVGSQQRTHSDIIHFDSIPYGYMAGVWTAMEDVDLGNGPLHYYPTSQRFPRFDMHDIGITAAGTVGYEKYPLYEDFVEALMKAQRAERIELQMKRGQSLIWSANLFHGGSPIRDTDRTRLSQVTHYYFEGCIYYTPLFSDLGLGKLVTRKIHDMRTGQMVPHYYNGKEIENPGEWPPRELPPWGAIQNRAKRKAKGIKNAIAQLLRP